MNAIIIDRVIEKGDDLCRLLLAMIELSNRGGLSIHVTRGREKDLYAAYTYTYMYICMCNLASF